MCVVISSIVLATIEGSLAVLYSSTFAASMAVSFVERLLLSLTTKTESRRREVNEVFHVF